MYESHFGFSGSPFQLNPDPAFYFDSRGHSNALAYLKFGAHQGEGFIVVTGEIGAGKTTLVRTLLEGLNPEQVVAAQVVSTQLESGELLQAILMSFGIASSSNSKAHLIGSLEAFLTSLAAKGRRALLIIDEAQNLKHEAVEELRMLSNFQLGKYGLLQSFLVGQPELRQLLQSKSMEQLRQRVIASCHLGPLQPGETRAYIEHRLRRVGWSGRPEFMPDAFERIHAWTGGVPRKINRLCNRLLLGAFLGNEEVLTSLLVDRTANELKSEIGELSEIPEPQPATALDRVDQSSDKLGAGAPPAALAQPAVAAAQSPVASVAMPAEPAVALDVRSKVRLFPDSTSGAMASNASAATTAAPTNSEAAIAPARSDRPGLVDVAPASRHEARGPLTVVPASKAVAPATLDPIPATTGPVEARQAQARINRRTHRTGIMGRPLICLVDSASDFLKAGTLAEVFLRFPSLPRLIAVHPGAESSLSFGDTGADELPMPFVGLHLENLSGSFSSQTCQVLGLFEQILAEFDPHAILVMGESDAILACSLVASKRGTPLFRIAGGQRPLGIDNTKHVNGAVIDKLSDSLYVNRMDSYYTLYQEGIKSDRVLCVGNLVGDMLKYALPHAPSPSEILTNANILGGTAESPEGFALVTAEVGQDQITSTALPDLIALVCELAKSVPVIWTLPDHMIQKIKCDAGSAERLQAARVTILPADGYLQLLGLLEGAKCLVSGLEGILLEEAASLRVPSARVRYDASSSILVADTGATSDPETAEKALGVILRQLGTSAPPQEAPGYWDSGTATRIANHLLLSLPKSEKLTYAKA